MSLVNLVHRYSAEAGRSGNYKVPDTAIKHSVYICPVSRPRCLRLRWVERFAQDPQIMKSRQARGQVRGPWGFSHYAVPCPPAPKANLVFAGLYVSNTNFIISQVYHCNSLLTGPRTSLLLLCEPFSTSRHSDFFFKAQIWSCHISA